MNVRSAQDRDGGEVLRVRPDLHHRLARERDPRGAVGEAIAFVEQHLALAFYANDAAEPRALGNAHRGVEPGGNVLRRRGAARNEQCGGECATVLIGPGLVGRRKIGHAGRTDGFPLP